MSNRDAVAGRAALANEVNERDGLVMIGRLSAALVAAGVLALPGAASAQQSPSQESAVPIPPGQIDAAIGQLDGLADGLMRQTGVPGLAVAVVHDDKVVYAKGFGVRKVGTDERVDENTVFQLASLSKPLGATVIARSVGRGKPGWDDPVTKYLPRFKLSDPFTTRRVTIADMYAHRSGLPAHIGDLQEDMGYGQPEILRRLRYVPLAPPLRSGYAYTNFGLTVGGLAAARAERTSWGDLSSRNLYKPLGMTSTSSRFSDYARSPRRAFGHVRVGDRWQAKFVRDADAQAPAGGASSSVADLAKWLRLQLADGVFNGKRLIAKSALSAMLTPHSLTAPPPTPDSRPSMSGLGIDTSVDSAGRVRYTHSGAFELGAGTAVAWLPSADLGIVALTNGEPIGVPESLIADFLDLAELGRITRDWFAGYTPLFAGLKANTSRLAGKKRPAHPKPALPASAYAGTYANRYYGPARIAARGGRLTMSLGPKSATFALRHWDGSTFSYEPRGENAVGISAVTFRLGRDGRPAAMNVDFLDAQGLGTFNRRR
jgi:CubicO group peptidase (beta-lactamase class C family)